ncbi:MAG: hypothetical protein E6772_05645 [Dysgonomonas sp.]|nr:hypothetical protein [Dysgonomonas sp.]
MNKIVLGIGLGIAAVCLYKKMRKDGYINGDCEDAAHRFFARTRRNVSDAVDVGMNEAEYLRERAEYGINKGKEKLNGMME